MTDDADELLIRDREELHRAIRQVKRRIKMKEQQLETRWGQLPEETAKAAIGVVLPVFMGNRLASMAWKLAKRVGFRLLDKLWKGEKE